MFGGREETKELGVAGRKGGWVHGIREQMQVRGIELTVQVMNGRRGVCVNGWWDCEI